MSLKSFIQEERGVLTLWILTWSILFLGFAGLAVDVSNAYRMRAALQATADSAAHAGVVALVEKKSDELATDDEVAGAAVAAALSFAQLNLPTASNGMVVEEADVALGTWNMGSRTFTSSVTDPNAVLVQASRSDVNANKSPLPTSLLRIIDFNSWNITVGAVATAQLSECLLKNVIMARQTVQAGPGLVLGGDLCVHGYEGLLAGVDAELVGDSVQVTMENAEDSQHPTRPNSETGGFAVNDDAPFEDKYGAAHMIPWDAKPEAVEARIDAALEALLKEIEEAALSGTPSTTHTEVSNEEELEAALNAGFTQIYVNCGNAGGRIDLPNTPDDILTGVTIITECAIKGTGLVLIDTTLMSYDESGSKQSGPGGGLGQFAVDIGTHPEIGPIPADCGTTSPSTIVTKGDVSFMAYPSAGDLRIISGGNIAWTAQGDFTNSIQMLAWGKIDMTAHNSITPCFGPGGDPIAEYESVKLVN